MKIITNLYVTGTQEDGTPVTYSQAMPEHLANVGTPNHWQLIDTMVTERTDTNLRQIAENCDEVELMMEAG